MNRMGGTFHVNHLGVVALGGAPFGQSLSRAQSLSPQITRTGHVIRASQALAAGSARYRLSIDVNARS